MTATKEQTPEKTTATQSTEIEQALLDEKLVTPDQIEDAQKKSQASARSLLQELVSAGAITEGVMLGILQKKFNYRLVSLAKTKPSPMAADRVPRELCEKLGLVAYDMDQGKLLVAMEDPSNEKAHEALHHCTNLPVVPVLAKSAEIASVTKQIPKKKEADHEKGFFYRAISYLFLPVFAIGPILIVFSALYFLPEAQRAYMNMEMDPFERILVFVLVWIVWAFIAYWISGLLFGTGEEDEDV